MPLLKGMDFARRYSNSLVSSKNRETSRLSIKGLLSVLSLLSPPVSSCHNEKNENSHISQEADELSQMPYQLHVSLKILSLRLYKIIFPYLLESFIKIILTPQRLGDQFFSPTLSSPKLSQSSGLPSVGQLSMLKIPTNKPHFHLTSQKLGSTAF